MIVDIIEGKEKITMALKISYENMRVWLEIKNTIGNIIGCRLLMVATHHKISGNYITFFDENEMLIFHIDDVTMKE